MGEEPDRVAMVSDLRRETDRLDKRITDETDRLDKRITVESARLDKRITDESASLGKRITDESAKLTSRIVEEGEATRRHFDIMVEEVKAAVKLVAEVNAHHAVVPDDHESRLKQIEKTR